MGCRISHDSPSRLGVSAERPEFHALAMPQGGRGEIDNLLLECTRLPGMRLLRIYTPAPELRGDGPLPVVLVNDGHKAFEPHDHRTVSPLHQTGTLQLHRVMDGLLCESRVRPAVVVAVAVHSGSRADQYVPIRTRYGGTQFGGQGEAYLDLLEHEVLPAVRQHLRHVPIAENAADRVLMGASIGGVSALYGAMTRPSVFGGAIALSPSAWVDDGFLTRLVQGNGGVPGRIAADIGHAERPAIREHCQQLFQALSAKRNGNVLATSVDGVHNEDSWRARVPPLLQHVLGQP
ncbi:MAG: alpha/beta hydrolase-fold protein [Planctomycetota bacterium]